MVDSIDISNEKLIKHTEIPIKANPIEFHSFNVFHFTVQPYS